MTAPDLVYFGDSLSDDGNLYALGEGLLPDEIRDALVGPTGAVSDGVTHAATTTALLGVEAANYALASAHALGSQTLGELVAASGLEAELLVPPDDPALSYDINLGAQIERFLADHAGQDLSQTTACVMIGGNDLQDLDLSAPRVIAEALALIEEVVAAQADAAQALIDAGVGTVWLAELPVAEFFAGYADLSGLEMAAGQLAAETYNAALADAVSGLQAAGGDVRLLRSTEVSAAIVEDPTGFGFLAPYDETQLGSDVLDHWDADQVAFYDAIHPSTALHGVMGACNAAIFAGGVTLVGEAAGEALELATTLDAPALIFAMAGDDSILATGWGTSTAFGGGGDDLITGALGNDLLSGGDGDDVVNGRAGDDVLNGGLGDDILRGMRGDDVLVDSLGSDLLRGGRGDDCFIFTEAALLGGEDNGTHVFVGGDGHDRLILVLEAAAGPATALDALLDQLSLRLRSIEEVVVLEGRAALADLSDEAWFAEADAWGLV
jgi:phospholipase/lecithinase/hemolysin